MCVWGHDLADAFIFHHLLPNPVVKVHQMPEGQQQAMGAEHAQKHK